MHWKSNCRKNCDSSHTISRQLDLDIQKYNYQFPQIEVKTYKKCHDRFLIIDDTDVYHIGASLKDLGKKMFAFSKLDIPPKTIMSLLWGIWEPWRGVSPFLFNILQRKQEVFRKALGKPKTKHYICIAHITHTMCLNGIRISRPIVRLAGFLA